MNFNEWMERRNAGEKATLPSGLDVVVKRASVGDMVERGEVPQTVMPQARQFIGGGGGTTMTLERFKEFSSLVNFICATCVVEPQEVKADPSLLPYTDRITLFNWANEVNATLKTFRREEQQSVDAVQHGEGLRPTPIGDVGVAAAELGSVSA